MLDCPTQEAPRGDERRESLPSVAAEPPRSPARRRRACPPRLFATAQGWFLLLSAMSVLALFTHFTVIVTVIYMFA